MPGEKGTFPFTKVAPDIDFIDGQGVQFDLLAAKKYVCRGLQIYDKKW